MKTEEIIKLIHKEFGFISGDELINIREVSRQINAEDFHKKAVIIANKIKENSNE